MPAKTATAFASTALAVLVALAVDRWLGNYLGHAGAWLQDRMTQNASLRDLKAF